MNERIDIKSMDLEELTGLMQSLGEPRFRAGQVFSWLHQKRVTGFEEMTNLSAALRQKLAERCIITRVEIVHRLVSRLDGTQKYLYRLADGNCIETVLMRYKHGNSLCISTQVGCRMGCNFCASTLGGLVRHLTPSEMLEQVYMTVRDSGERVDSLVLMGIGEPLDNYDNVIRFIRLLTDEKGYNLGQRHISLSTCGLVDRIYDLAEEDLQITLSISLHAADNETRNRTMPVNRRYPVEVLMAACRDYFRKTGRRISFEYALIKGVNDTPEHAGQLARLLDGMICHVNLIPVNPVEERGYDRTAAPDIRRFVDTLTRLGVNATVRRELGSDINAACGQLRRQNEKEEGRVQ
ncbi:MAG: 23S rRNA (adenine(2503)-C(2))-methyltransferase RlmN [Clostridiales bacterium]|nr:23S rRNA (adenine(2503)-C(2))-methyltransferase RlmN [Clostridiales bacterium]